MIQSDQLPDGVIVITGASGGIGNALLNMFANKGRSIVAISRPGSMVHVDQEVDSLVYILHADLADKFSLNHLASKIKLTLQGRMIAALINTAGILTPVQSIKDFSADMLISNFAVNAVAPAVLTCGLSDQMMNGARVLNLSSRAAVVTIPGLSAYCMSKHALHSVTSSLQLELPGHIAVSSLIPGEVDTSMQNDLRSPPAEVFPLVNFFRNNIHNLIPVDVVVCFVYWVLCFTDSSNYSRKDAWCIYDTSHHDYWMPAGVSFDYPEP